MVRSKIRFRSGFTLVEVLVGAALSALLLVGILTTFVMMGRVSASIQNYSEIEISARKALEVMGREIRMARDITTDSTELLLGTNGTSVTLSMPDSSANPSGIGYSVTFAYNSTTKTITRTGPPLHDLGGSIDTAILLRNVQPITGSSIFFYFRRPNSTAIDDYEDGFMNNALTTGNRTSGVEQIEVKFLLNRQSTTVVAATNKVLSAQFVLRNKG
jgi:prepilin-type N-terminal cleavage/methylation domain-containing protein